MKFGVGIPTCRESIFYPIPFADTQDIVKLTQLADQLGYHSVWGTDFINPVSQMKLPDSAKPNWYELMISLAYLAAATNRINLGAGVVLLPYRDPVILAKQAATLDQFSGGRFLFGWGLGGFRDEFVSINAKNRKAHRGKMLEEHMEALHLLLNSEGPVSFEGEYYEFHDVELNPKPTQKPLPIYIAGHTPDTPARIAKWATGASVSITAIAASGGSLHDTMERLKESLEKEGVDPSKFDYEISTQQLLARTREEAVEKFKSSYPGRRVSARSGPEPILANSLVGTPDDVVEQAKRMEKEGITLCTSTNIAVDTFDEMLEHVQWFAEEVMPKFE